MTFALGGVLTAPTDPGARSVSTDGAATRQASIAPNREGGSASGRRAERVGADTPDLPALIVRAQAGDPDAIDAIYRQFVGPVYAYVAHRVTGREVAEDVTSTVFVNALRGLRKIEWRDRDMGAWLFTIARNAIIDRSRAAYVRWEECHADPYDTAHPPIAPDLGLRIEQGTTVSELWAAVRRLPDGDRKLVFFRFVVDLSVAETALALGVCEGTVKSRTHKAITALREDLTGAAA